MYVQSRADMLLSCRADPFANDENFLLSMLSLEELGATGNKVRCYATHLSWCCRALCSGVPLACFHDWTAISLLSIPAIGYHHELGFI